MCAYAIKKQGLSAFTGTAPVRLPPWSWSEEERCSQITACLLSTLRTPRQLHCHCCPLHARPSSLSLSGTDCRVWFPPCLASMMCLTLLSLLMLNHAASQKWFCFKNSLESSGIFVCWFTETVAFSCKLTTVHVPLVKPPYNYLQMLAPTVWPLYVEGQDGAGL